MLSDDLHELHGERKVRQKPVAVRLAVPPLTLSATAPVSITASSASFHAKPSSSHSPALPRKSPQVELTPKLIYHVSLSEKAPLHLIFTSRLSSKSSVLEVISPRSAVDRVYTFDTFVTASQHPYLTDVSSPPFGMLSPLQKNLISYLKSRGCHTAEPKELTFSIARQQESAVFNLLRKELLHHIYHESTLISHRFLEETPALPEAKGATATDDATEPLDSPNSRDDEKPMSTPISPKI